MRRITFALGLISFGASAGASPILLHRGAYVMRDTSCGQASDSTLMWWTGAHFAAGRSPDVTPRATGKRGQYRGSFGGTPFAINVKTPTSFVFDGTAYSYCPPSALPADWRGYMPG